MALSVIGSSVRPVTGMSLDAAETVAVTALSFIARDEYRSRQFLKASGLEPGTLRQAAASRAFFLGVLDYLAGDEGLLKAYAVEEETHPQTIMAARSALAPPPSTRPAETPSSSIVVRCEHCKGTMIRHRRELPQAPPGAVKLSMPRCGKCGGGFDQIETWLDRRGNEVE